MDAYKFQLKQALIKEVSGYLPPIKTKTKGKLIHVKSERSVAVSAH